MKIRRKKLFVFLIHASSPRSWSPKRGRCDHSYGLPGQPCSVFFWSLHFIVNLVPESHCYFSRCALRHDIFLASLNDIIHGQLGNVNHSKFCTSDFYKLLEVPQAESRQELAPTPSVVTDGRVRRDWLDTV